MNKRLTENYFLQLDAFETTRKIKDIANMIIKNVNVKDYPSELRMTSKKEIVIDWCSFVCVVGDNIIKINIATEDDPSTCKYTFDEYDYYLKKIQELVKNQKN